MTVGNAGNLIKFVDCIKAPIFIYNYDKKNSENTMLIKCLEAYSSIKAEWSCSLKVVGNDFKFLSYSISKIPC